MARTSPVTKGANTKLTSTEYNDQLILNLQHLLGFTLDGVDLNTIASAIEMHNFTPRVAPVTPASGFSMYADSADDWLKTKNDAGRIMYFGESVFTRKITLSASGEFNITLADYEEADGATAMIIDYRLRSVTAATNQFLQIQFNGELATTNYFRQSGGAGNGAGLVGEANDQIIDFIPGSTSPANSWQRGSIYIYNLEAGDVHLMQVSTLGLHTSTEIRNNLMGMSWNNTAAITSIRLLGFGSSVNLESGSWIKLRFIKEAY